MKDLDKGEMLSLEIALNWVSVVVFYSLLDSHGCIVPRSTLGLPGSIHTPDMASHQYSCYTSWYQYGSRSLSLKTSPFHLLTALCK